MRRIVLAFAILAICAAHGPVRAQTTAALPPIEIYFSPYGGCTEAVDQEDNPVQARGMWLPIRGRRCSVLDRHGI